MLKRLPILLTATPFNSSNETASFNPAAHVPPRQEIPVKYQWRLQDIYVDDSAWKADFDKLKTTLPSINQYKDNLSKSPQNLLNCLKARDEIGLISGKLYGFTRMHRDENTADQKYQAMTGQVEGLLAEAGAITAFIEPEILALPDETLAQFRQQDPGFHEYSFYFDELSRQKQHVLSPAEEEILSRSIEVTQAPENIFNMLAHADIKFPPIIGADNIMIELSEGRYRALIMSQDRDLRQQAFSKLYATYNQYRNTFAATLGGSIKKNVFYSKTRKYKSTLQAALETDNVPQAVYDNLITTVHSNLSPLHRYVSLKRKALKLDKIHMYDLYTPLVPDVDFNISHEDGLNLVRKGLEHLGAAYADILNKGLTAGWIDVYENQGKQTGAYSWGVYGIHPFVLLNYNNRYDDVSTTAHEMGHAIHSYYSQANQPYATAGYTTFCAEVASTTNEILLLDYMLKTTTDKRQKLYLINQHLEAVRGTIYRQTMFAEFEKIIYEKSESGETITADLLDALWHDLNVTYYGPEIMVDKDIDVEWARIPHFYSEFYVYQYVTGYSAATALAQQVLDEGEPAQKRYIDFLKSGGSDYSLEILKRAGVDMSLAAPLEVTLHKFATMLDQLETLLENPAST